MRLKRSPGQNLQGFWDEERGLGSPSAHGDHGTSHHRESDALCSYQSMALSICTKWSREEIKLRKWLIDGQIAGATGATPAQPKQPRILKKPSYSPMSETIDQIQDQMRRERDEYNCRKEEQAREQARRAEEEKKEYDLRLAAQYAALEAELNRIAREKVETEERSKRIEQERHQQRAIERAKRTEADAIRRAHEAQPSNAVTIVIQDDEQTIDLEQESQPEQSEQSQALEKKRQSTRWLTPLTDHEKELLHNRFGQSICEVCAAGPHSCHWSFTGVQWACERCNIKKTSCKVNGIGVADRRDQWVAAIRGGVVDVVGAGGSGSGGKSKAASDPADAIPRKRKRTRERDSSSSEISKRSDETVEWLKRIAEANETNHQMLEANHKTLEAKLEANTRMLERMIKLHEESNRVQRAFYARMTTKPVELSFLGNESEEAVYSDL
ncbi:hypothetical protein FRC17_003484 [Serendipita sp. 399]|nr:hypothetical protein FRC17_003484 [Serendipita sp. 399]